MSYLLFITFINLQFGDLPSLLNLCISSHNPFYTQRIAECLNMSQKKVKNATEVLRLWYNVYSPIDYMFL